VADLVVRRHAPRPPVQSSGLLFYCSVISSLSVYITSVYVNGLWDISSATAH